MERKREEGKNAWEGKKKKRENKHEKMEGGGILRMESGAAERQKGTRWKNGWRLWSVNGLSRVSRVGVNA